MKLLFLIALFITISCETVETVEFSSEIIDFYKCLLLDSDIVYYHINSLVESIEELDPIKFSATFTTIYPLIVAEVTRCEILVKKNVDDDDDIVLKNSNNSNGGGSTKIDFFKALLKYVVDYIMPFLKPLGINLKKVCNEAFPDTFLCDLLE